MKYRVEIAEWEKKEDGKWHVRRDSLEHFDDFDLATEFVEGYNTGGVDDSSGWYFQAMGPYTAEQSSNLGYENIPK